jgi:prepilin-type N-terminal cleavage/methylation domain-containing protein
MYPFILRPFKDTSQGMTLLEILMVLSIVAILVASGGSAYETLTVDRRLDAFAYQFENAVRLTRTEAMRNQAPIQMQPLTASDWGSGLWIGYAPRTATSSRKIYPAPSLKLSTSTDDTSIFKVTDPIQFNRQGQLVTLDTPPLPVGNSRRLIVCASGKGRALTIEARGQVMIAPTPEGTCL